MYFYFICVICCIKSVSTGVSHVVQTTESNPLSVFESYSDVQMLSFIIPENVIQASWNFHLQHLSGCSSQKVSIYARYGSYPIINTDNSSFPEHFHVENSTNHYLELSVEKHGNKSFNISSPLPGMYYMASFIQDDSNKIQQQGLSASCSISLAVIMDYSIMDVIDSLMIDTPLSMTVKSTQFYKFVMPIYTSSITIKVYNCSQIADSSSDGCPITIAYRPLALPDLKQTDHIVNCEERSSSQACTLEVSSSSINKWSYLLIHTSNNSVSFDLLLESKRCNSRNLSAFGDQLKINQDITNDSINKNVKISSSNVTAGDDFDELCYRPIYPTKMTFPVTFKYIYSMPVDKDSGMSSLTLNVSSYKPTLVLFELDQTLDIGGTLNFDVILFNPEKNKTNGSNVTLVACIQSNVIPDVVHPDSCSSNTFLIVQSNATGIASSATLSIPFPQGGPWYLVLKTFCLTNEGHPLKSKPTYGPCASESLVFFHIQSDMCVKGGCGTYGTCYTYISGGLIFSACGCTGGWRGWGCTDGSHALSNEQLLTSTLLLTLSNLLFIPAIILAIRRRYFTEAAVYFFTMFFSTFYHACDSDVYTFCLMRGSVMQFCDFYASIMSFWVTVIALSDLPDYLRSLAHMIGALGIAFGVEYNRTGLWVFIAPFAASIIIMTSSWVHHCRQQKACYPEKKRWLLGILPGVILAGSGLILFAFFETKQNYPYVHSAWHAATALSILVLLPFKKNYQDGQGVEEVNWKRRGSFKFLQDNETDML